MQLPRMRTLDEAYQEILNADPNTSIKKYAFRQAVLSGKVPSVMVGSKRLINIDELDKWICPAQNQESEVVYNEG